MYRMNTWNENEEYFPQKVAQDVLTNGEISTSYVKSSCCIDTTNIATHKDNIRTSCCIDTTKE